MANPYSRRLSSRTNAKDCPTQDTLRPAIRVGRTGHSGNRATVPAPNPNTENRGKMGTLNTLGGLWLPPGCLQIALLINVSPHCEQGCNFAYRLPRQAKMVRKTPFLPGGAWAVIIQKSQLWTRLEDIKKQTQGWLTFPACQQEPPAEARPNREADHAPSPEI